MNKTSYSKRGLAAFSALLIVAILLSLTLTNIFSSKAEETAALDQVNGNTTANHPFSSTTNTDDIAQPNADSPSAPSSITNTDDIAQPYADSSSSNPSSTTNTDDVAQLNADSSSSNPSTTNTDDVAQPNADSSTSNTSSTANTDDVAQPNTDAITTTNADNVYAAQPINDTAQSDPVPGQVVIQFSPDSSEQERAAYVDSLGGTVVNTIEALDTVVLSVTEATAQEPLPVSAIVEQAEQAHFVSALGAVNPNDPKYTSQWALSAINASSAWAQIPDDTPIVTVAVIDTGICAAHEDLVGRISAGWDFVDNDANPQDANWHGCFVSGLIAANMNNGIGIAGVAPNTRIMPLRVLDANGYGYDSDVAEAIVYAANNGAQVINLSLGGTEPSSAMENAVNYAVAKGVSVVAAAGNNGTLGALYPARYAAAIAVGSLDSNLQHSSFSNYGPDVDIWAPGGNIISTYLGGGYISGSGTSFAAPYVAGAKAIDWTLNRITTITGGNLDFNASVTIAAAANDNFANAINITSLTLPYTPSIISTTSATTETNDPALPGAACAADDVPAPGKNSRSVWYKYTAASSGILHVDTMGSNYDTVVAIWTGTSGSLTLFACNNNEPAQPGYTIDTSYLELPVTVPTTYYIEVTSFGTTGTGGSLDFNFDYAQAVVPNDEWGSAITITSLPYSKTPSQDTRRATLAETDPELGAACNRKAGLHAGLASVWYSYTPSDSKEIQIDTRGSNYDTILSVWTGTSGAWTLIGCNNDIDTGVINQSSVIAKVTASVTYYIIAAQPQLDGNISGASSITGGLDKSGDVSTQYVGGSMVLNVRTVSSANLPATWVGGAVVTANKNIVAVGRPHVGTEVTTYDGFSAGALTAYLPMLFKNAWGSYNSAFYIENVHAASIANITIKYYDSSGALSCTKPDTIAPLASKGYWVPSQDCLPDGWVGGVTVTSDQPIVAVGRPHIGEQVMTYNGFSTGAQLTYVPMLFKNAWGSYDSALYVQNVDSVNTATITIKFYDSAGSLTCTIPDSISPLASKGYWVPSQSCLPDGWVGGAVVEANHNIVAVGRPHIGNQITTYDGFTSSALSTYVPMLFKNAWGSYDAALYVQNVDSGNTAAITIKFYDSAGSLTCTITDNVSPLASKGYWVPSQSCLPDGWVGGAVVYANHNIVAVGRPHIGAEITTYNGFTEGTHTAYIPMLFKNGFSAGYDSALYVQNVEASAAVITITLYDSTGDLSCIINDTLEALSTKGYWIPTVTCGT